MKGTECHGGLLVRCSRMKSSKKADLLDFFCPTSATANAVVNNKFQFVVPAVYPLMTVVFGVFFVLLYGAEILRCW
jgi:hypothetical protein